MAIQRENPYSAFNFQVDFGGEMRAGFQEVSGLGLEIQLSEYREGTDRVNAPRKIAGLSKVSDVTLKRGVIGSLDLWQWIQQTRDGDPQAARTVTIRLLDESRQDAVQTWRLINALPIKYRGPLLVAAETEIAMEELVLAAEGFEVE